MPQPPPLTRVRERLLASASRLLFPLSPLARTRPSHIDQPQSRERGEGRGEGQQLAPFATKSSLTGPLIAFDTHRRPVWTPRDYQAFAREGFMQNAIVYRCVRMIAEAAASVPLLLYAGEDEIAEHPLLRLVSRPNPSQTYADLIETLVGNLLVSGNAYIEAVAIDAPDAGADAKWASEAHSKMWASEGRQIRELHALRPDRMKIIPGLDGWPEAYEYTVAGRSVRIHAEPVPGVRAVLHIKQFHPDNDHYGLSPLEAAAGAIDLHNTAAAWNKALLDNSARPSGALVYTARDGNLSAEQYERLKSELESGFQGSANAGRPLLLEGGLDWKSMSLSPKDMDFIEARHVAAREIALALGVPPMLLGIPGDNTFSNMAEAQRIFWRATVLPLVNRLATALSHWLAPAYINAASPPASGSVSGFSLTPSSRPLRLVPDLDSLEALAPERESLRASLEKTSFLTPDEKRAAIGYGPMSPAELSAEKYNPWHIPAGNGRESGQFTSGPGEEGSELPQRAQGRGGRFTRPPKDHNQQKDPPPKPPPPVPPILPPSSGAPDESLKAIDGYRSQHNLSPSDDTVAHAKIDGADVFGVNSSASAYTPEDRAAANQMRDNLIENYPETMQTGNIGHKPNDALYHAEATALIRAAQQNGGSLAGRTIELRVDRPTCNSCDAILPLLSRELGYPTIVLRDTSRTMTIRNGRWVQ